jgi:predicted CxxxxCH...CXXCH cytochrome family protein
MADAAPNRTASPTSRAAVLSASLVFAATSALFGSSCLDRRDTFTSSEVTRCATCHGDPSRSGDYLQRAAPPHDTTLATDVSYPGVGAHQIHLRPSATHAAVACDECHRVPRSVDEPGHADSARPAELTFGALSRSQGRAPSYDAATRTCRDTYCHRAADAVWTSPRDSVKACGSCHGLPPKAPHPASNRCSACHGRVVDDARRIIAPSLHVDGVVEYTPSGCTTCHGRGDDPAPPVDTEGNDASTSPGVGAHQAHLTPNTVGRALACEECHVVPSAVDSPGHVDGVVQVVLSSVATSGGHDAARFDPATRTCMDTWCHGAASAGHAASPDWTSPAPLGCDSCHGNPPPAPHPQMTSCAKCHGAVVTDDGASIKDPSRHVDGTVDVAVPDQCTSCHGSENPAPPADVAGHTATTAAGVGAHQTHVKGTARSRPVPCDECHVVPKKVLDEGHVDSPLPAEVRFAGAATAFGATPQYAGGTCRDTSCHGAVFPDGDASGGTNTVPIWTQVDGTQARCGACHGLPPPPPHPYGTLNPICSKCHADINPDNATFVHPELHVDGRVTFEVP